MTSAGGCREFRHALGVYVLGAIDPAERALVDDHLAICLDCREELAALAGLPALLRKIPIAEAERLAAPESGGDAGAPEELLRSLLDRTSRIRRTHRWRGLVAAAAAVLVALGGGAFAANAFQSGPGAGSAVAADWHRTSGSDTLTGAKLTVKYLPTAWGTQMNVQVSGLTAGTVCDFEVVDAAGHPEKVGSWRLDYQGGPAWYPASTALPEKDLRSFEIVSGGRVLAEIPVS